MMNILRNVQPSLISLKISNRCLTKEMLHPVAELILYTFRKSPKGFKIPVKDSYSENPRPRDKLLREFARQLGLEHEIDLNDFDIAGLAIMIADNLYPHVDGFNPKGKEDVTIQINTSIAIKSFPPNIQELLRELLPQFKDYIPFTLILYPRRCVISYENRMLSLQKFPSLVPKEIRGRQKMIQILLDVGSTYDYNSRFFTRSGYTKRQADLNNSASGRAYHSGEAAIDKMVSALRCEINFSLFGMGHLTHPLLLLLGLVVSHHSLFPSIRCKIWNYPKRGDSNYSFLFSSMQLDSDFYKSISYSD